MTFPGTLDMSNDICFNYSHHCAGVGSICDIKIAWEKSEMFGMHCIICEAHVK